MELGGNAHVPRVDDADIDDAWGRDGSPNAATSARPHSGEPLHVADSVADGVSQKLADRRGQLKLGRGPTRDVDAAADQTGPAREGDELWTTQVQKGARCSSGRVAGRPRLFFEADGCSPTVAQSARLLREDLRPGGAG